MNKLCNQNVYSNYSYHSNNYVAYICAVPLQTQL